ncbi:phospholipid transfer protein isoform X1 [Poecilia reticulata]|uniref:phospholipid transfer protein isoform X1 n=2 Tax=Poecilia reticulata TaxID=8081 RepID=UPI0004A24968|nr:PREDICTED: phospholipid transfer protein isoform X1 [Poecilia reticulata]
MEAAASPRMQRRRRKSRGRSQSLGIKLSTENQTLRVNRAGRAETTNQNGPEPTGHNSSSCSASLQVRMTSLLLPLLFLSPVVSIMAAPEPAGCKIRITDKGLELLKIETQRFVEEELSNISMPEMKGTEGRFQYTITDVKITELNLSHADLQFLPDVGLLFDVQNSSIALSFQRRILYWFFYDTGNINASADGVNINTAVNLIRDDGGRLKINNISCDAKIKKMRAEFSGTLGKIYDFLARFLTTGMRFFLNQQICPALNHAALVHVNAMLETIPVRSEVDHYIGIDYSLISDPVVTSRSLDMNFRGMFFDLSNQNQPLVNYAVEPIIREYDRMVYLALSEFFFDSGMFAYYSAGIFQMHIVNEKMPKDLEVLLRTTYFGTIMMMNPALVDAPLSLQLAVNSPPKTSIKTSGATVVMTAIVKVMVLPPGQPPVQLSSMTMEAKFNAKVSMRGKRLAVHADLRRFKIFSNQSALESLALIPLQAPLKTMLQMSVVPLINNWTKRGVRIPLADGMDFIEEVVEYHNGFIVIGANLHFSKGLREMMAGSSDIQPTASTAV